MFDESDLLRLLEGECSPEEAAAIQAWIAADPARVAFLDELRALWRLTGATARDWDTAAAVERLRRARGRPAADPPVVRRTAPGLRQWRPPRPAPRVTRIKPWAALVAATVVVAAAGTAIFRNVSPTAPHEYVTAPGQRLVLRLSDGSEVRLSVDTRLRVPRTYGLGDRVVELEGEAFFTVRHDPERPFLVRTRHGTAEDLGTQFDVRAYPEDNYLRVVVASGRVALRGPTAQRTDAALLTLRPRDLGVIDAQGVVKLTPGVALERHLAWRQGQLVFEDAPVTAVIAQLARWYDLAIEISDQSLEEERITITFTSESADEALSALARVLDVSYVRTGRVAQLGRADSL